MAFLREKQPTLVHCLATSPDTDTESIIAMWLAQIPWRIVTFAHVPISLKSDGIRPLYNTMMKRLLRTLNSIIVYTNTAKQQLHQNFAISMTPIHVIPIGIDSQRYALHTLPHISRRDLGLPDTGRIMEGIYANSPKKVPSPTRFICSCAKCIKTTQTCCQLSTCMYNHHLPKQCRLIC
jgi:hypothetical protein